MRTLSANDLKTIAWFNKIVMNYLNMKEALKSLYLESDY